MKNASNPTLFALLIAGAVGFAFAGCNCGPIQLPLLPDGGSCTPGVDCPVEGTCVEPGGGCTPSGVPCCVAAESCLVTGVCGVESEPACVAAGADCGPTTAACCNELICNESGKCAQPPQGSECKSVGEACDPSKAGECCNAKACIGGVCSESRCRDVGQACSAGADCCTLTCGGDGLCADLTSASDLRVIGQACTEDAQCASNNCQGGYCARSFTCQADYDVCTRQADCCSGNCTTDDGVTPGYCDEVGGTSCDFEGQPCTAASACCTQICADQGFGSKVCVPAGGCRIDGTTCTNDLQCCRSEDQSNPSTCQAKENTSLCSGTGCNAVGNTCGLKITNPDGSVYQVPARSPSSCCDGAAKTCKLDSSGIPRCFGGGSVCEFGYDANDPACCIAIGNACAFSDQCCDGNPCIADDAGVLRCTAPPSCDGLGSTCDPAVTPTPCCSGTECLPTSEVTYACQIPSTNPPDCKANGSSCANSSECCSQICEDDPTTPDVVDPICTEPDVCVGEDGNCSTNSDCCTGLSCNIPSGSVEGTCQPSSCQNGGQTCSPTLLCCSGLKCLDDSGLDCTGANPCSCQVILQ